MSELEKIFERLGLVEYLDAFIAEGFDTWETVLDITEEDFEQLGVLRGHRRRLQREIATTRGIAIGGRLYSPGSHTDTPDGLLSGETTERPPIAEDASQIHPAKRRYRRHPKPDENAPKRPPSAYVLFSNAMREELKDEDHSFVEIAKLVGERWQNLPAAEREIYDSTALAAKEKYNADNARYKKTQEYRNYRLYLDEFRAKANANATSSDTKPPRLIHSSTHGSSTGNSGGVTTRVQGMSPVETPGWKRMDNTVDFRGRDPQPEARLYEGVRYSPSHRPRDLSDLANRSPTTYGMTPSPSTSIAPFPINDQRTARSPALPSMPMTLPRLSPNTSVPIQPRPPDQYLPHPSTQSGLQFPRAERLPPPAYMSNPGYVPTPISENAKFTFSPPNLQSPPNISTARGQGSVILPPINSPDLPSPRSTYPPTQSISGPSYQRFQGIGNTPAPSLPPIVPRLMPSQESGSSSNHSRNSESGPGPPTERSLVAGRPKLDALSVLALAGDAVEDESTRKLPDGSARKGTQ